MSVTEWLLEGDPAIRWQVMRDLTEAPEHEVSAERSQVASEGWGARLLGLQAEDGQWGGGAYTPKWTSTTYTLLLLRHLGLDPESEQARRAVARVRDHVIMGSQTRQPFFTYRGETCITAMCLALAAYFGEAGAPSDEVVEFLLAQQLEDGGWNCQAEDGSIRSSFHTTISVLEGLLEYEQARGGRDGEVGRSRARGQEYLLERRLLRSLSTGDVINAKWTLLSFPPRWHYDVLRGLDYLRAAGLGPDERCAEAVDIVEGKRARDGRWPLQNPHPGKVHFAMDEGAGKPSRWNTLRASRVLMWYRGE